MVRSLKTLGCCVLVLTLLSSSWPVAAQTTASSVRRVSSENVLAHVNGFLNAHRRKANPNLPVEYACQNPQESEDDSMDVSGEWLKVVKRVAWQDTCPTGVGGSGVDVETYVAALSDMNADPYFSEATTFFNLQLNCKVVNCFKRTLLRTWTDRSQVHQSNSSEGQVQFVSLSGDLQSKSDPELVKFKAAVNALLAP